MIHPRSDTKQPDKTPPVSDEPRVLLAHGGGGELMQRLIRRHILPVMNNEHLRNLADAAVVPWSASEVVFTTDSYVVTPLVFPGGDIGRLAVAGTINDLAVMGAAPTAISLGLILEEGLPLAILDQIMSSIAATAKEAGVMVVTGDTKVIERRAVLNTPQEDAPYIVEGMMINTAGIGYLRRGVSLDIRRIRPGDAVLISGTIADHGLAIMSLRKGLAMDSELQSDTAPLNGLIGDLLSSGVDVKFMRDPTRGGVAGVLADIVESCEISVEIEESRIPVSRTARHLAELLGLDPLTVANEGKVLCVVADSDAERALAAMQKHPLGKQAARVGRITDTQPPLVELITRAGGRRIVQRPYGEELPRIC